MPQIDKVTFYYVTFWFITMFIIFYIFLYLIVIIPILNTQKVYLRTLINKLSTSITGL
jgi:hypothetical protein